MEEEQEGKKENDKKEKRRKSCTIPVSFFDVNISGKGLKMHCCVPTPLGNTDMKENKIIL